MEKHKKIRLSEKLGYGLGDFSCNLVWQPILMYLLIFYTDVFGISPSAAATLFLVARIWDAINDPIMGAIIDRTQTKWGKFRPYMLFSAIPYGLFAILTFTVPNLDGTAKLIYAYVTYIGLGMLYTVVNTAYSALSSSITQDSQERSTLSVLRVLFAMGAALVGLAVPTLVTAFGGGDPAKGYQLAMTAISVFVVISMFISFASTKERYSSEATKEKFSYKEIPTTLFKNKELIILCLFFFLHVTKLSITQAGSLYHLQYVVNRTDIFPILGIISLIFTFISAAAVPALLKKFDKKSLVIIGLIVSLIRPLAYFTTSIPIILIGAAVSSLGQGIVTGLLWGLVPDVVEFNEYKHNKRQEGLIFSLIGLALKLGTAFGGVLPGIILQFTGYQANMIQTPLANMGITSLMSLLPLILTVLSILVMTRYGLTTKRFNEILKQLHSRKEETIA